MPSALVNKYAVYFDVEGTGKVKPVVSRQASLLLAVESCIATYEATGHFGYWIEDERGRRTFALNRRLVLALLFLRSSDQARYFGALNQLEQSGTQAMLESALSEYLPS